MFCPNCGKKLKDLGNFCEKCGSSFETIKEENEKSPIVGVNVSKKQTVLFYPQHLLYGGERINYKDIVGMSYLLTNTTTSVYFVPVNTSVDFEVKLETHNKKYSISSKGTFLTFENKSNKEKEDAFGKLFYLFNEVIKPCVLINLLKKYEKQEFLLIDSLSINKEGIHKSSFFGGAKTMLWSEYFNSQLSAGNVFIYCKDQKKKYKVFHSCSMSNMNTVILPDLLSILFQCNGVLDEEIIKIINKRMVEMENIEEKTQNELDLKYCPSCAAPVSKNYRYCNLCGNNTN